jgi:hypothetical protein
MGKGDASKLLGAGTAAAAVGGAYKFGEFLYKAKRVRDVGPSNAVYVRLISRVRLDLDEVKRLLTVPEVKEALEANPPKAKWVYGAMRDVRGALENITPLTERVGGDIEEGRRVGMRHRLRWLLSEKEKLENREKEVNVAHASLTEVIGFLTALEPVEKREKHRHEHRHEREHEHDRHDRHDTRIDIDIRRDGREGPDGPDRYVERDVYVEHDRDPRRVVEQRDVYIERDRAPPRYEEREERGPRRYEEREAYADYERGPGRYEERETYVERRDPRHEERYYEDRHIDPRGGRVEERELHIQRDPRDPRHVEAQYTERGPGYYDEKRYEERRFDGNLPRRPESFEDRVPDRDTFMESNARRPFKPQYGEYAEYGAPQPSGPAEYGRKFLGDPGFGDDLVLNPQIGPRMDDYGYEREVSSMSKNWGRYN